MTPEEIVREALTWESLSWEDARDKARKALAALDEIVEKQKDPDGMMATIQQRVSVEKEKYRIACEERDEARADRDKLAEAIRDAAVSLGIARREVALTGPHLVMLCEEITAALKKARADALKRDLEHLRAEAGDDSCADLALRCNALAAQNAKLRGALSFYAQDAQSGVVTAALEAQKHAEQGRDALAAQNAKLREYLSHEHNPCNRTRCKMCALLAEPENGGRD